MEESINKEKEMNQTIKIEGMTCMHCKMSVEKALKGVVGVTGVQVDLAGKKAVIEGTADEKAMVKAVEDAGFKVVS